jgi:integrase/recombinase XerD
MDRAAELADEIRQITEQYRKEVSTTRRTWPSSIRERVIELKKLGLSSRKVFEMTGIPEPTVWLWSSNKPKKEKQVKSAKFMPTTQDSQLPSRIKDNSVLSLREANSSSKSRNTQRFKVSLTKNRYEIISDSSSPETQTISQVREFLTYGEIRGLSIQTLRSYAYDLLAFLRWWDPTEIAFADLTQTHLLIWVAVEREKKNQPRTINRRLATVLLFYECPFGHPMPRGKGLPGSSHNLSRIRYDRDLGISRILARPSQRIKVKVPLKELRPLDPRSVGSFFESVQRYRDLSILSLLLFCGLRSSEVRNLRLKDIHYFDRTIRVFGKGSKERIIPVPDFILGSLERYMHFERPSVGSDHVFLVLQGKNKRQPLTPSGFRTFFRYRRQKLTIPQAHPRRFRHTFGAELAKAGVALTTIRNLMGYGDIQTTLKYISLSVHDIRDEYDRAIEVIRKRYEQEKE